MNLRPGAIFQSGMERFAAERYAEAVPLMLQAIDLEPDNAGYHYNLGLAYFENGDLQKAIASWDRVVALDPDNQSAKILLGLYTNQ